MKRQKYDTVLFVQRFLRCKLSAISWLFGVSYQKHRAETIKIFITYTLWNCCIKTEKCHKIELELKLDRSHTKAPKSPCNFC